MPYTDEEAVAAEIRGVLAKQGRKRGDVAGILGISPTYASRKLNGHVPFSIPEVFLIARALGVHPAEFFRSTPTPSRNT